MRREVGKSSEKEHDKHKDPGMSARERDRDSETGSGVQSLHDISCKTSLQLGCTQVVGQDRKDGNLLGSRHSRVVPHPRSIRHNSRGL